MGVDGPSRISNKIMRLIEVAKEEAYKSTYRYRLGAIVLKNGKVISRGYNDVKMSGKLFRDYNLFSLHAECMAIMRSGGTGDTLVVVRLWKNGHTFGNSRPCDKCFSYIKETSIKKVIYVDGGKIIVEKITPETTNEKYTKGWKANNEIME